MYDQSTHTTHSSSLPAVLDGPGGGGGSVLEVYMSKRVKEILNFTTNIHNLCMLYAHLLLCSHMSIRIYTSFRVTTACLCVQLPCADSLS